MIDRVELQRILGYYAEVERRKSKEKTQDSKDVEVSLSEVARNRTNANYEDLENKVRMIKDAIARGTYEVDPQKILKGLEKYLSSR